MTDDEADDRAKEITRAIMAYVDFRISAEAHNIDGIPEEWKRPYRQKIEANMFSAIREKRA